MGNVWPSFGIGFVAGMRTMTATAALVWAASMGRVRAPVIPGGPRPRTIATAAALAEMAGDKMFFAPDRRIMPSFLVRIGLGAVGGSAIAGRDVPFVDSVVAGVAGAVVGTYVGRFARGGTTRTRTDWARALTEDAAAAGLGIVLVQMAKGRRLA